MNAFLHGRPLEFILTQVLHKFGLVASVNNHHCNLARVLDDRSTGDELSIAKVFSTFISLFVIVSELNVTFKVVKVNRWFGHVYPDLLAS